MFAVDLHPRLIVSAPDWEDGQPVRILSAHSDGRGVSVHYQDVRARHHAHQVTVAPGFELDLISGGCGGGAR
jgi:hypothetical protein